MPLIIPPAPAESIAALQAVLPAIAKRSALTKIAPNLALRLAGPSGPASLSPALSYRVYTLGLSDLSSAARTGLRAATLSSWRHTLVNDGEVVAAEISVDRTGSHHRFSSLTSHPSAFEVQKEILALGRDPAIAKDSYEISLLQISALGVRAVWLHDPMGKSPDLLVPVPPVRSELVAGRRYQIAEFAGALMSPAERILADDDPRKGSG